jgi:hypothetical protein
MENEEKFSDDPAEHFRIENESRNFSIFDYRISMYDLYQFTIITLTSIAF